MVEGEVSYGEIDVMVQNPPRGFKRAVAEQADLCGFGGFV